MVNKTFTSWYKFFGEELANKNTDDYSREVLDEAIEYVNKNPLDVSLDTFVTSLKEFAKDEYFGATGTYITALIQDELNKGTDFIRIDFHQLGNTPKHLASFLKGNKEGSDPLVANEYDKLQQVQLYGNLGTGVAGVGIENLTLHMGGFTGLKDMILLGGEKLYDGKQSYGVAMHAKNSIIFFHDQEYNTASGANAENCIFGASVESDRTICQIKERAGKDCQFFHLTQ